MLRYYADIIFYHVTGKLLAVNQHKLQALVRGHNISAAFEKLEVVM